MLILSNSFLSRILYTFSKYLTLFFVKKKKTKKKAEEKHVHKVSTKPIIIFLSLLKLKNLKSNTTNESLGCGNLFLQNNEI